MSSDSEDFQSADEGSENDEEIVALKDSAFSKKSEKDVLVESSIEESIEDNYKHERESQKKDEIEKTEEPKSEINNIKEHIESEYNEQIEIPLQNLKVEESKSPSVEPVTNDEIEENVCLANKPLEMNEKFTSKPLKVSKIGVKKPRDKLGDRLGGKKLGSRTTKPIIGISSDTLCSEKEVSDSNKKTVLLSSEEEKFEKETNQKEEFDQNSKEEVAFSNWSAWGGWSSTLLNAASNITREVSKGVGSVMETVEESLGAPDPSELAKEIVENENELQEMETAESAPQDNTDAEISKESDTFGFNKFISFGSVVSGAIENASNKVLLGSLDTLEFIGRKTMDVLQEGDPRFEKKRAFISSNTRPNLSQILKEAKEKNEEPKQTETGSPIMEESMKQVSLLQIWDATEGPAHLEALSIVSKQCHTKTQSITHEMSPVLNEKLQEFVTKMKNCCELKDDIDCEDVLEELDTFCNSFEFPLKFDKIPSSWKSFTEFTEELKCQKESYDSKGLGLRLLERDLYTATARFMVDVVGLLHKAAELSLVTDELDTIVAMENFQKLCSYISFGLERVSDSICENVASSSIMDISVNNVITNIYLQMAEGNDFLQQSLRHLLTTLTHVQAKRIFEIS